MDDVLQYRVSIVVVLAAMGLCFAIFAFARPQYHVPNAGPTVDLAEVPHHSVAAVRAAFAAHGIKLRYATRFSNMTMLGAHPAPWPTNDLYVFVGGAKGSVNWGDRDKHAYEAQFDNLLVHDGRGGDETAVKAAVGDLR